MTLSFERSSDLALILAYVISVCLYLHIPSAFVALALPVVHTLNGQYNDNSLITLVSKSGWQRLGMALVALALGFIMLFAVPVG